MKENYIHHFLFFTTQNENNCFSMTVNLSRGKTFLLPHPFEKKKGTNIRKTLILTFMSGNSGENSLIFFTYHNSFPYKQTNKTKKRAKAFTQVTQKIEERNR